MEASSSFNVIRSGLCWMSRILFIYGGFAILEIFMCKTFMLIAIVFPLLSVSAVHPSGNESE